MVTISDGLSHESFSPDEKPSDRENTQMRGNMALSGYEESDKNLSFKASKAYTSLAEKIDKTMIGYSKPVRWYENFESAEQKTGLTQIIKAGVERVLEIGVPLRDEIISEYKDKSNEILEAIVDENASDNAKKLLRRFQRDYHYSRDDYSYNYFDVFSAMHDEWVKNNPEQFFDQDNLSKSSFLPFNMIGTKKARVYKDILGAILAMDIKDNDEDFYDFYVCDRYSDYSGTEGHWSPLGKHVTILYHDTDGSIDDDMSYDEYEQNDIVTVFSEYSKNLHNDPVGFYSALPEKVAEAIRSDKELAQGMIYSFTFGENSLWPSPAREKGFLELINSK